MMAVAELPETSEHLFVPAPENARTFRNALGAFTTGVTVVTIMSEHGPTGVTVNSFASVSLDPPLVLWSLSKNSSKHELFLNTEHYAIHVLEASQFSLSRRFTRGGTGFDGLDWTSSADGVPVIADTLARFECVRFAMHDGGDHTIMIGRVLRAAQREGEPLCFSRGSFGHFAQMA